MGAASFIQHHTDSDASKHLEQSPFSQLLNFLSHDLFKKSSLLTDRLIRLLTHVTYAMSSDSENNRNLTVAPAPAASSETTKGQKYSQLEKCLANEDLLKLVVNVLISKTCSEEGLVDATSLLIKLSTIFPNCRTIFYKLLLDGVRQLGENVFTDMTALAFELEEFLSSLKKNNPSESLGESFQKGILQDRYSNSAIVVSATSTAKHSIYGKQVQLSSMSTLISKSCSQFLFLRILKMIVHIREISTGKTRVTSSNNEIKMEVDKEDDKLYLELQLDQLWTKLSECLVLLSEAPDDHAVLVLQPAVEAFFLVHAPEKAGKTQDTRAAAAAAEPVTQQLAHINDQNIMTSSEVNFPASDHTDSENYKYSNLAPETQKFLFFAEKHRVVLNQILRQSSVHLANGPFAVLVDHTRILDFDVKRRYFRQELERLDHGVRRDDLAVHIRRENVFEDSFRELNRRTPEEWKNRFYVVFEGEEGQDAGGLLREWFSIIAREIFNPNYGKCSFLLLS